jgi:[acyl-carrier-protein] S-malonyltransferase
MKSAQPRLAAELAAISLTSPRIPVISNVTGKPHGDPAEILDRLVDQVTHAVRWEDSIRFLLSNGVTRFIEVGPGTALSGFMKRIDPSAQVMNVGDVRSLEKTVGALKDRPA